ncbi:MAG: TorF family putative porin [Novosphingobium sp.]|nr:TorF family putative porin [Novosphingobium sp.]
MKAPPVEAYQPWDIAFGSSIASDYVFRGVTQSNHQPSASAYFEPRYNFTKDLQAYVGTAFSSISFANRAAAEVDIYGGIRPTFGALAFDFGVWGYLYPGGQCTDGFSTPFSNPTPLGVCASGSQILPNGNVMKKDVSFYEIYAKATYNVNDNFAIGGSYFYSPDYLAFGFDSSYAGINAKWTTPTFMPWGIGTYVSGEYGHQWLGTTDAFYGSVRLKDYNTWNVGVGFTKSVFTLDLRYSSTDMSKGDCNALTSDFRANQFGNTTAANPGGIGSGWCGDTFVAKLGVDLTAASNLK